MTETITLPEELNIAVSSESKDFAVKGKHAQPPRSSFSTIAFGIVWLTFISVFGYLFIGPIFSGEEVQFISNGVPVTASPENLSALKFPAIFLGLFFLIGFYVLGNGIYSLVKKGGYFVGTPSRLIHYKNGRLRSIDWEQFTGDIEVRGKSGKGSIMMVMRTGRMVSSKNNTRYVPDTVYISGIPDVFEIEQICRKRIKENDPTPATK